MNDEETVALIAGGHTFGKTPRRRRPEPTSARSRRAARSSTQGLGWKNTLRHRQGQGHDHQRARGRLDADADQWDNSFFENLFGYEWELAESPAGAKQWTPKDGAGADTVPDAHDASMRHAPMMLTTDLALRLDPVYEPISRRFLEHPEELADAFAKAWYKLLHRDMGPVSRYLGPWVAEAAALAGPGARGRPRAGRRRRRRGAQGRGARRRACRSRSSSPPRGRRRPASAAPTSAAAPTARGSGWSRSGSWEVNEPGRAGDGAADPRAGPAGVQRRAVRRQAGLAGRPDRARRRAPPSSRRPRTAGHDVTVPFAPGRTDASQEQTDVEAFAVLEPQADGFRNYLRAGEKLPPETLLLDRANLLDAHRAGDDGAGRRPARARRQQRRHARTASSPTGPGR